ncbi:MAG: hypothetical protein PHS19_01600 [Eubacteriales bacterium]|nr:hypothetical protein [Eubacteriales bacterium]
MKEKLLKLSKRELILLIVLVLIAGYYFGVQLPVSKMSVPVQQNLADAQAGYEEANIKVAQMAIMERELISFKTPGTTVNRTPSFDNTNDIIMEMNSILGGANNYTISFGDTETDGNIVRRPIDLQFSALTYSEALKDINRLENSKNGYLLIDATVSGSNPTSTVINKDGSTSVTNRGNYGVSVKMTSFEYLSR